MDFKQCFPKFKNVILVNACSDHYVLLLSLEGSSERDKSKKRERGFSHPFHFESFWLKEEDCGEEIKLALAKWVRGNGVGGL